MAKTNSHEIWPGSMWLPEPGLSLEEQCQQELEMMAFINNTPCGILKCKNDDRFTILRINDGFLNLLGYTHDELSSVFSNSYLSLIHPDDRQQVLNLTHQQMNEKGSVSNEYRVLCKDGSYRWIAESSYCAPEKSGVVFFCMLNDITDLYETREDLRLSLDRHNIIMRQSKNVIFEWDKHTNALLFSANWAEIFGYPPLKMLDFSQMAGRGYVAPQNIDILRQMMAEIVQGASFLSRECQIKTIDGTPVWCRIQVTSQLDLNGQLLKIVGDIANIDVEKRMMDSLRQKAERDPLTGLYDKAAIQNLIEQHLEAVQSNEKCALLMIDIDDFKVVNNTMGHLFGDAVLSDLSASIQGETRSSDLVGRIGGDEFLVFLKNIPSAQTALQKSQRLLSAVQDLFREKKNKIAISCSIGISLFPAHGHNFRSLYQCADIALYQAKGKNTSCLYSEQMLHPALESHYSGSPIDSDRLGTANTRQLTEYVFQTLYHAESIEQAIPLILDVIGCQFGVSRAYVFENSEDGCSCSNTFEWCNVGISSQKEKLQNIAYASLDNYMDNFDENGVFFCQDIENTPQSQRTLLRELGIYSLLQCAMCYDGLFAGFVGFDECTGHRLWTDEEIHALTLLSEVFNIFLLKKREIKQAEEGFRQAQH